MAIPNRLNNHLLVYLFRCVFCVLRRCRFAPMLPLHAPDQKQLFRLLFCLFRFPLPPPFLRCLSRAGFLNKQKTLDSIDSIEFIKRQHEHWPVHCIQVDFFLAISSSMSTKWNVFKVFFLKLKKIRKMIKIHSMLQLYIVRFRDKMIRPTSCT